LWGLFGWFNVLAPDPFYWIVDGMTILGALGFALFAIRSLRREPRWTRNILLMLFVWLCLITAGVLRWAVLISSQGRLAFPALAAAALFLVTGWAELVPRRLRAGVGIAGTVAWAAWAAVCPGLIIQPAYAQPPALDPAQVAARIDHEVNVTFQGKVTLLGYRLDRETVMPGEEVHVTACWRGRGKIHENYFAFVQVLVENDLIAAQRDTYHGLGSFPTSVWPAGVVFCDQYPLRIADTVPEPGPTTISMGLYRSTGERLRVTGAGGEQPAGDQVRIPGPRILFPKTGRRLPYDWGGQIALLDYELDTTAISPGGTFDISLTWSAVKPVPLDYAATLQVLDPNGHKIGQSDAPLQSPTWQAGARQVDRRSLTISAEAVPGVYEIKLAIYDPATVENLTLYREKRMAPSGGLLTLWTLRVLPE
jgi:hypothetical protein